LVIRIIGAILEKIEPLLLFISAGLKLFMEAITWAIKILTFGIIDLSRSMTTLNDVTRDSTDAKKQELELLKKLNDQYAKLRDSIREQEEYYLQRRRKLNADWAIETLTNVNDMILTPQGTFSTNPNDYIIATKHPETLNSGAAPVYVQIINNTDSEITEKDQTDPDGTRRIKILVDQTVQNGIASGRYDGAFNAKQKRDNGRRIIG
jgi:hypothetical protein